MPRQYRIAVIGRKGRHGHGLDLVWKAFDNVEVVAVADEDEQARAATAKKLNARAAFGDYRDMLEMRGRGIEDKRPAPHDLISHGTHIFDLMRLFHGEARWCLGRVLQNNKPITRADVHEDTLENVGLIAGDKIDAIYGFDRGV